MSLIVNTNIASLNSQRALSSSQTSLTKSLQRLSTGLRINSAADDPAGLGIANRMTSQLNGLSTATTNANTAISLAQTAEGGLSTINDDLQTIRSLAVEAANGTNTSTDRASLQAESSQLVAEIQRVATSTQYNGLNLLDGSFTSQQFQVGSNVGQTISFGLAAATTDKLGGGSSAALSADNNGTALGKGDLVLNGTVVGASLASYDTASYSGSTGVVGASAIAKVAAINAVSSETGVSAEVNANTASGTSMTASAGSGTLTINGVTTQAITTSASSNGLSRASVVQAINAISQQTGVSAVDTGDDKTGVKLVAADGRNIDITTTTTSTTSGSLTSANTGLYTGLSSTADTTVYGSYTLSSESAITVGTTNLSKLADAGLTAGTYQPETAYISSNKGLSQGSTATGLSTGDVSINGILVGAQTATSDTASYSLQSLSAIGKAAAINKVSAQTGVTATVNANTYLGSSQTLATTESGTLTINGVATASFSTSSTSNATTRASEVAAINAISAQTGVTAVDTGDDTQGVQLVAADGRNITVSGSTTFTQAALGLGAGVSTGTSATEIGTISLSSASSFTIDMGSSGNGTAGLGIDVGSYGSAKTGQALDSIDISTVDGANKALTAIDNAIATVTSQMGDTGAIQSRFSATVSSLQITTQNLTSSKSTITDTDYAAETSNLSKQQILQQAGIAMLAQANSLPQQVLTLLK